MIIELLFSAVPLVIAASGGLLTVVSGPPGVFLEGFMVLGAFGFWAFYQFGLALWLAASLTAVIAALAAWLAARFVALSTANPFIVGLALNLAASGLVDILSVLWFGTKGVLRAGGGPPAFTIHRLNAFTVLAWLLVLGGGPLLKHTVWGLRLRACGSNSQLLKERGLDPLVYRSGAWAIAAALAALAGAALTYRLGAYIPGGVAGRGWIALVVVYLGFKKPLGIGIAALAFAAADLAAGLAQSFAAVPATLLLGLPSALALGAFSLSSLLNGRFKPNFKARTPKVSPNKP